MIDLRLGDCLEVMKTIPDNSVDLVVTSPPYNQNLTTQDTTKKLYSDNLSDIEYKCLIRSVFQSVFRILKPKGSFFYNYKTQVKENRLARACVHVEEMNKEFLVSAEIVWNYAGNFDSAKTRFPTDYEMIYQLTKTSDYNFYHQGETLSSVWNYKHVMAGSIEKIQCGCHPCPYPVNIINKIIRYTTQHNNIVLDPFMGSGTTGVACKELGRNFIGIEISPEYFKIAERRINQTMENLL